MHIVKTPAKILNRKAKPVTKFDKKLKKFVAEMSETLKNARNPEGVGLAAPQIGILKRLFVMQVNAYKKNEKPRYQEFINPEIISRSRIKQLPAYPNPPNSPNIPKHPKSPKQILEGCLSIDNVWGFPKRLSWVKLCYQDLSGKKRTQKFSGFPAVIAQHEVDHLNGILFTHHVLKQKGKLYSIEKDEKTKESTLVPLDL